MTNITKNNMQDLYKFGWDMAKEQNKVTEDLHWEHSQHSKSIPERCSECYKEEDLEREDDPKFGEEEEIPDGTEDINDYD